MPGLLDELAEWGVKPDTGQPAGLLGELNDWDKQGVLLPESDVREVSLAEFGRQAESGRIPRRQAEPIGPSLGESIEAGVKGLPGAFIGTAATGPIKLASDLWAQAITALESMPVPTGEAGIAAALGPPPKDKELKEYWAYRKADEVDRWLEETFPQDEKAKATFIAQLVTGGGSLAGFAFGGGITSLARLGPTVGMLITGAGSGFASGYDEAKAHGADEQTARFAGELDAAIGLTEVAGEPLAAFKVLRKADDLADGAIKQILKSAGWEGAQEAGQQAANNVVAGQLYDENRGFFDGVLRAGAIGGILGSVVQGFAQTVKAVRERGVQNILEDYQQRVEAGQADATPSQQVFEQNGFDGGTRKERAAEVQTFIEEQQNAQGPIPDVRVVEGQVRQDAGGQDYQRGGEAGAPQEGGQVAQSQVAVLKANAPAWLHGKMLDDWASGKLTDEQVVESLLGGKLKLSQTGTTRGDLPPNATVQEYGAGLRQARVDDPKSGFLRTANATNRSHAEAIAEIAESAMEELAEARQVAPQGEVEPGPKTGLRNEITDAERAARNAPPIARAEAVRNPVLWAEAERVLQANPNAGYELVEGFEANPRTLSDLDAFVLLRHKVNVRARHEAALRAVVAAQDAGDDSAHVRAKIEENLSEIALGEIEEVSVASGSQWGKSGRARQVEAAEDYSLSRMVMKKRADLGRALKPEELAHVKELSDKIAALETKLAAAEASKAEKAVDDFILKNEPQKPKAGSRRKADARKAVEDAWKELLSETSGKLFSIGAQAEAIPAWVKLGKAYIQLGVTTLQDFLTEVGKRISADVLEKARPAIERAWQAAIAENKPTAAGRKLESPASMTRFAKELGRHFLQTGVKGRDAVIDAVHAELLKVVPGMTRRQAAEAIVGYGQTTPLSKDAIEAELRSIVGEERELLKQEDIARKIVPPRSGPQFQKPGGEERRLKKLTSEAMKRAGLTTTDPETQLQSSLQSIETRLRNQIADVQAQIDKGERLIKERKEPPTNERIEALREQLEVLNERLDAIAPRPGRTEQQRLDSYKKRLMARNAELTDKLARKDYSKATRKPPPTDPEVEELLAQRDDLHREVAKMRAKDQFASLSPIRKVASVAGDLLNNVQRALVLGLDLSFLGLQAGAYHAAHPIRAIQNDLRAFSAMSQKRADALARRRRHSPNAALHRRMKLAFTDPHGPPNANEEVFRSSLIDRIPGLSHLSRFATELMNGAREDWADTMAWGLSQDGKQLADHEAKAIGSGINIFTSRGNFGDYQGAAKILYLVFLAPKHVLSRFQIVLGQPMWRGSARTRIAFAKEYARIGVGMASLYGLVASGLYAAYGEPGDDKEWDIWLHPKWSEDRKWGQLRIGDQLYDFTFGLRAVANLLARQAGGLYRAAAGKKPKYDPDPLGGFGYFVRTKLNVYPRAYVDFKKGETITGEKATPLVVLRDLFSPITAKEIVQKMDSHGVPRAFIDGFIQALGFPVTDAHRATKRKGRYPREIVSQP